MPDVALSRTQVRETRDEFVALNARTGVGSSVVRLCDSHEAFRDVARRLLNGYQPALDGERWYWESTNANPNATMLYTELSALRLLRDSGGPGDG